VTKVAFFRRRSDDALTRDEVKRDETDVRGWGSPPFVRAVFTLIGVGAAGLLIWLAQTFDLTSTNGFWAAMGLIAAASAFANPDNSTSFPNSAPSMNTGK